MRSLIPEDVIVACSTGTITNTAIGVIRISGFNFLDKINHFFSKDLTRVKARQATFCKLLDGHKVIDEIVLTYFQGPYSYNGEDIVELSVHGNQININRIIDLFTEMDGFRLSNPGEFTLRSLQNKKLSITQVEGLDLLLNARNIFSLDQGFSLLSGKLQSEFLNLYDLFLNHKSALEFGFDFLEDVGEAQFKLQFKESLKKLKKCIKKLNSHVINQSFNLIKPEISLYGLPNAGKSTLFNILLNDDRAIVSDVAGTTRDFLTEDFVVNRNLFTLVDTAGIRYSDNKIEAEGIERAIDVVEKSFFKLLLVNPFEFNLSFYEQVKGIEFDLVVFSNLDREGFSKEANSVVNRLNSILVNKIGPIEPTKSGPIEPTKSGPIESIKSGPIEPIKSGPIEPTRSGPIEPTKSGPIEPTKSGPIEPTRSGPIEPTKSGPIEPTKSGPIEPITCSLVDGENDDIGETIRRHIGSKYLKLLDFDPVLIDRHRESIKAIDRLFLDYENTIATTEDMAIISSELNIVGHCISELIGIVSPDDVLHNIFDNFCIGK